MTDAAQAKRTRLGTDQTLDSLADGGTLELGREITRTAKTVERALTTGVERQKVSAVAVRTLMSVRLEDGGPLQLQRLAEEAGVTRANASAELVRLEADGLIVRRPDPHDGRRIRAKLTRSGHHQLHRWIKLGRNAIDDALGTLDPGQRQRLYELAGRVGEEVTSPAIADQRLHRVEDLFPDIDLSPLTAALALGRAEAAIRARVDEGVAASSMTSRQVHALILVAQIDGGSLQFSALAPLLGVNRASVGRTLRELEDRGLVLRNQDDHDRRRIRVALTPDGRKHLDELMPVLRDCYESALSPLNSPERTEMLLILRRIEHNDFE